MAEATPNDPLGDLPPSLDPEHVIRAASGGRLLARLGVGLVVLAAIGAGAWFGRREIRRRVVRERPTAALPAASVRIGNDARRHEDPLAGGIAERPAHDVAVGAFAIDKSEVTVGMYAVCVDDGACVHPTTGARCNWGRPDREHHPVNCVSFAQAEAFCAWSKARLPTEMEWEYAAGGATPKRTFPWGEKFPTASEANLCGAECSAGTRPARELLYGTICSSDGSCRQPILDIDDGFPETAPVGSFPAGNTPEGVFDMGGNVWEWTSSLPCEYPAHACADAGARVIRGSGWTHRYLMSPEVTTRDKLAATAVSDGVGFRCVR
jgi:formylglycine-generating enzyme required for sulfatase activity